MTTLSQLKKLAASLGCSVEDDKENTTLYVHAENDKAWEDGELTALMEIYGSGGSYLSVWRQTAIDEIFSRLEQMGQPDSDAAND